MVRVTTLPALRIRYSSGLNSRGCSRIGLPARWAVRARRSISRSPVRSRVGGGAPARQRLDAGKELGEGIGLGEIVVAASAQTLDLLVDIAERRQDQHRGVDALRPH